MRIVAFIPDLIDRSRVTTVEPTTEFVDQPAQLAAASRGADLVLVDLTRDGAVAGLDGVACRRVVGFANHTAKEAMESARRAGAVAMARSEFFIRLEELIFETRG